MASHKNKSTSGFVPRRSNPTAIRSSASGRPRSLSLYSPSSSPSSSGTFGVLGLHTSVGGFGSNSPYLATHSSYGSPSGYSSPSSVSTYGGTSSGYGGLTVHRTPSTSSIGLSSSPSRSSYYNSYLQNYNGSGPSSRTVPSRASSFNRALTNSRSSLSSTLGSRSGSLSSLASTRSGSEGYLSGSDVTSHSSRLSSASSAGGDSRANTPAYSARDGSENGELDYKKLYEEAMIENERLREKVKKTEEDLNERTSQLDKLSVASSKNSLTEMEKRERRAMERKLSEMEEELKQLQKLKGENERLKAENRALTRVVSKLTNSANATKQLMEQIKNENQRLKDENGALIRVISKLSK